jgi:tetratricopeptide (TPR) repeat protein
MQVRVTVPKGSLLGLVLRLSLVLGLAGLQPPPTQAKGDLRAQERALSTQLNHAFDAHQESQRDSWMGSPAEQASKLRTLLESMINLAWFQARQGRRLAAEDLFQEAVRLAEDQNANSTETRRCLDSLLRFQRRSGKSDRILKPLLRLIALQRRLPRSNPTTLAPLLAEAGSLEHVLGDLSLALKHLQEAISLYRLLHGPRSAQAARLTKEQVRIFLTQGDLAAAETRLQTLAAQEEAGILHFGRPLPPRDPELQGLQKQLKAAQLRSK